MYHEFYDLTQNPFSNTPDPAFLYLSPGHKAVLQALLDSLQAAQGCVALVGEAGLGKTLLLRALLERLDHRHYQAIWVWYPALSLQEMLKSICQESGRDCPIDDPVATAHYLQHIWLEEHRQGRKVLLIIDEAHNIPGETLEGLLRLASLNVSPGKSMIHIVFAGLPEFWRRLHACPLRYAKKPYLTRVRLSPFTRKESLEYIRHRLMKVVASADAPFTNKALQQVVHYARGNPGMLNTLCTNMLIRSRLSHEKLVSVEIAQEVLAAYRKRRSRTGLWRGIAYAASVLLVASLVGAVQYEHLAISPRGSLELSHLMQRFLRPWSAHGAPQPVDVAVPILQREPIVPFVHPEPAVSSVHVAAMPELQMLSVPLVSGPFEPQLPEPVSPQSVEVVATQLAPASFESQSPAQGALHAAETASQEEENPPASPSELPVAGPVAQTPVAPRETVQATKSPGTGKTRHSVPSGAVQPPRQRPPAVPPAHMAALQAPRTPQPAPKTMTPRASGQVLPRTPERAVSKRGAPATAAPVVPLETGPAAEPTGAGDARGGTPVSKSPGAREEVPVRDRETLQARPDSAVLSPPLLPPGASSFEGSSQLVVEAGGHAAMIRQLLFTADGRELISVSDDKTIRVWSVTPDGRQASLARTIRGQIGDGPEGMLAAATLSPPNAEGRQQWLAVGGVLAGSSRERYAVRLHDYVSGEVVSLLHGHEEAVLALAFSPTGRWLASAGKDCTVRLWDLASFQGSHFAKAPLVLAAHTDHIYDLAWSATGDRLASASYDHSVGLWNTEQLVQGQVIPVARLRGHDQQVQTVAFHPEGSVLASGGKDQTIRLWRAQDGEALGVFARPKHKVSALSFAPDGRSLLAGNFSPPRPDRLTLLAYPAGKTQQVFTGHQNVVVATAFHPGGQWVASGGGEQKEILLWQVHTGEVLSRLAGTGQTIYAVGFSRDGRYLSWGQTPHDTFPNTRGSLEHRFDLAQLARLSGVISDPAVVRAQESVGDVALLAERGGPYDHHYRLHVHKGPRRLSTLERSDTDGYRHSAYTLTPDGQGVLSGGMNGVLRLYALDGTLRARFLGHTGEIRAVAVSADGQWALSGSNDQTLRLWSLAALPTSGSLEVAPTLTLFPAIDGEWVAWTPEGAMVASPHGASLLGHSINQGPDKVARYVPVEQWPTRPLQPEMILPKLQSRLH